MHHRRFDFDVAPADEKLPQFRDDPRALDENLAHRGIRDQIEIALAIANVRIGQSVEFFGKRQECFRQQIKLFHPHRQLIRLGAEKMPRDADDVSKIERTEKLESFGADGIKLHVKLQPLPLPQNVCESGFSVWP